MPTRPPSTEPADHHYVPKFYLKGFMDKRGALWVYEKGATAPRGSTPKGEAHRENYYTFADRGYPDTSAERVLSNMETLVAPTIRKVGNPGFEMTERQRRELYSFIALSFVRVPAYRNFLNDLMARFMKEATQGYARDREKFYELIRDYELETGQRIEDPEKLREFAAGSDYTVTQSSEGFNLLHTFKSGLSISNILEAEYQHDILYSPANSPFLTCDNPIVTIEPDVDGQAWVGMGFGRPKTEVIFPLNKRACIILGRRRRRRKIQATVHRVEQTNRMLMAVAQRYVYASTSYRRLARIFNEQGCKVKYGENAFMQQPLNG